MQTSPALCLAEVIQRETRTVVGLTTGVFDLFHLGHSRYLEACRRMCDILVVGVDDDELARTNKGSDRPYDNLATRLAHVSASEFVSQTFVKMASVELLLPTILPSKYFVSANRVLSSHRLHLLKHLSIELASIPYTTGISTTIIAKRKADERPLDNANRTRSES